MKAAPSKRQPGDFGSWDFGERLLAPRRDRDKGGAPSGVMELEEPIFSSRRFKPLHHSFISRPRLDCLVALPGSTGGSDLKLARCETRKCEGFDSIY